MAPRGISPISPSDTAHLYYTSGTTARPKGALHVHEAVSLNGWRIGEYQGLVADDVVWFYYPLFFSAGCINVMLGTLCHGAALILQPAFEPGDAIALIEREQAAATARLVADIMSGRPPPLDLAPFRPQRFGSGSAHHKEKP